MAKLTQKAFAEHVGVSQQAVSNLAKDSIIDLEQGLDACRLAYIDHLREQAAGRASEGEYDLVEERARLAHHQANKTALEEAVLEGKLIHADKVERVQGDMVSAFRAKMLSLPTKAAHSLIQLETLSEAQDAIKPFIYEALRELADYEPQQYGIESLEKGSSNGRSTSRDDSQRMG